MTEPVDLCIIGAGVAGGLLAAEAVGKGLTVTILEAGTRFDRAKRFEQLEEFIAIGEPWPYVHRRRDAYVNSSEYAYELNGTRVKAVGGTTLHWGGLSNRLMPSDFETHRRYGLGYDWPISYADLEPYYVRAESELGVSGEFHEGLPPRSAGYPMPAFPDGYADRTWRSIAARRGIAVGPAPYAKNSVPRGGRPACQTFATCRICPIGAQYSGDVHVTAAEASGRCRVMTETVARRIEVDAGGTARRVHATTLDGRPVEVEARHVVIAAHTVESARLLLLSGVGNHSDQVGRNLMEHWYIGGRGRTDERFWPGRIGFHILESAHFYDRGREAGAGAAKLEFYDGSDPNAAIGTESVWGKALARQDCEEFGHWLGVGAETEHQPHPESRVTLDPKESDLFGDPVPHIHFHLGPIEHETRRLAAEAIQSILEAGRLSQISVKPDSYSHAAHHLGTCRMSRDPDQGVVDSDLRVHGVKNLYVLGGAVFPTGGALQPTLTISALALRLADQLTGSAAPPRR